MIKDKIIEIIQKYTGYDGEIFLFFIWDEIEADSLDLVEIVMAIEEEYGIGITDDEAWDLYGKTIGELVDAVERKVQE
jgi:acyl carrier protein